MMTKRRRATMAEVHVRPLLDTAVCDVEELELLAFEHPWSLDEIYTAAQTPDPRHVAVIARSELGHTEEVLGWAFYRRDKFSTTILRIATHPSSCRMGIGRKLVESIAKTQGERTLLGIWLELEDTETPGFLEAVGFVPGGTRYSSGASRRFYCRFRRPRPR